MNRTLVLTENDRTRLRSQLIRQYPPDGWGDSPQGIVLGDCFQVAALLPQHSIDLLILDPPYNLTKTFNQKTFLRQTPQAYTDWLDQVLTAFMPLLKPSATVYICGDWLSSVSIYAAAARHLIIRNRITWEREKGRGARSNWKNASEDIWFCTVSHDFLFDVAAVKLRRRVMAPYRQADGRPKDWQETGSGNFRDTHPSNFWTDITVPFWSMTENTCHPTQKSEKLMARLLLASSLPDQLVCDPFLGSGTTCAVAKKLGRRYLGIEIDEEYCLLAARRLELADTDRTIQGYTDGVFWERNTLPDQGRRRKNSEESM